MPPTTAGDDPLYPPVLFVHARHLSLSLLTFDFVKVVSLTLTPSRAVSKWNWYQLWVDRPAGRAARGGSPNPTDVNDNRIASATKAATRARMRATEIGT